MILLLGIAYGCLCLGFCLGMCTAALFWHVAEKRIGSEGH